jgi:trehalose/maltose hydrolase-like predicted phosphorylase
VLVPQVMLRGFMGFAARGDGFELNPHLPQDWPELTINRIRFQNVALSIRAKRDSVEIEHQGQTDGPCAVYINGQKRAIDWKEKKISFPISAH